MCERCLKPLGTTSSTPKASKCQFCRSSVHVTSERGVAVDPSKVAAVAEWAPPASWTDVRRFVVLANYYRKFVRPFSTIAAPLTTLCSPRARFKWSDTEQKSFDALKVALTATQVLRVWDPARRRAFSPTPRSLQSLPSSSSPTTPASSIRWPSNRAS